MPVVLLERLPLPSLQAYTSFSVVLLASSFFFAHKTVLEHLEDKKLNETSDGNYTENVIPNGTFKDEGYMVNMANALLEETWCVWTLINMAYCCLILVGKVIQKIVFGELRVIEQQHIKDKFWNFVFYKFIFIFGVMNVQNMDEVVYWCAWFSILGFLHLMAQLCKNRFEYLSFSPTTPRWTHVRVLSLLAGIQFVCSCLLLVCIYVGMQAGINTFAFMAAECILLIIKTLYVIFRYSIHLWDVNHEGVWENRALYIYYTELVFELAALIVDFAHHLHMLIWGNIFLSMASLVICMQLRYLFHEFQRRIKRHKNYLRVVNSMEAKFPMATVDDLEKNNDDCAICWDRMENARKLPCGHLFHNACLRSWLEQDTSCPTCRTPLNDPQEATDANDTPPQRGGGDTDNVPQEDRPLPGTTNHFFHFDGSRYVSWLPSFSVEVTHTQLMAGARQEQMQTSQLDNMARQVQGVFPTMPVATIQDDLRHTRSVEQTIENILEGRLVAPPTTAALTRPSLTPPISSSSSNSSNTLSTTDSQASTPSETSESGISGVTTPSSTEGTTSTSSNILFSENSVVDDNVPDLNLLGLVEEMEEQTAREEHPSNTGGRFSKSSSEREEMLVQRKEGMVEQARRRYLAKKEGAGLSVESSSSMSSSPPLLQQMEQQQEDRGSSTSPDVHSRRELMYEAVRRRLNQDPSS